MGNAISQLHPGPALRIVRHDKHLGLSSVLRTYQQPYREVSSIIGYHGVRGPLYVFTIAWPDAQAHGAVRPPLRAMHGTVGVCRAGGWRDLQCGLSHDGDLVSRGCHIAAIGLGHDVELRPYGVTAYRHL